MIHIEISKGTKWELLVIPSLGSRMDGLLISKMTCDKTYGVSPTQKAHLSLGAQRFYWGSVTQTWLTTHVAYLGLQTLQRLS